MSHAPSRRSSTGHLDALSVHTRGSGRGASVGYEVGRSAAAGAARHKHRSVWGPCHKISLDSFYSTFHAHKHTNAVGSVLVLSSPPPTTPWTRAHNLYPSPPRNLISTAVVARVFILRFPRRGSPTAPITAAPPTCPVRRASAVSSTPHRCVHSHLGVRSHVRVHSHPARPSSPLRAHPSELTPSSSPLHSCSHPSDSRLFHRLRARTPRPPPHPHRRHLLSSRALVSTQFPWTRANTRIQAHTRCPTLRPFPRLSSQRSEALPHCLEGQLLLLFGFEQKLRCHSLLPPERNEERRSSLRVGGIDRALRL